MGNLKSTIIVLLISLAMSLSIFPAVGYAQFFQPEDNSVEENLTTSEFENNYEDENLEPYITEDSNNDEQEKPSEDIPSEDIEESEDAQEEDLDPQNKSLTVTFKYLDKDSNKSIAEDTTEEIPYGEYDFSKTDAPEIEGYEYVEMTGDVKGTIEKDSSETTNLTVNLIYKKVEEDKPDVKPEKDKFKLTFFYIDELTSKEIAQREEVYLPIGSPIEYDPMEIENYIFHHAVQVEFCDGSVDVYLFYGRVNPTGQYRIRINYLEESTNKVLANAFVSDQVEDGFGYNVSCRDKLYIPGYKYVKTVGNTTGVINGKDVEINVYYKKAEQYRVTINYIDYNSKKQIIKSFVSIKLNEGDAYNVTKYDALNINGYKYYKTEGDPLKGYIDGNKVINVYYLKNGESAVKTGDYNNLMLWVGIALVAIIVIIAVLRKSRKNKTS